MEKEKFNKLLEEARKLQKEREEAKKKREEQEAKDQAEKLEIIEKLKDYFNDKIIEDFLSFCIRKRYTEDIPDYGNYGNPKYIETYVNFNVSTSIDEYFAYKDKPRYRPQSAYEDLKTRIERDDYYKIDCLNNGESEYKKLLSIALKKYRENPNERIENILSEDMIVALLKYCKPQEVWHTGGDCYYVIDKDKVSDIALEYNIVTDFKAKSHFILEITYAHLDELFKIDDAYDSEFLIKTKS